MSDKPDTPTKPDYRSTVFLPKTDFPMKAGLPQKEPVIAARWKEQDLYGRTIEVALHSYLRPEMRFDSLEALKVQMDADAEEARRLLLF